MRANLAALCLAAFAGAGVCYGQSAQETAGSALQPGYSTVYCSGFLKDTRLPGDLYVSFLVRFGHCIRATPWPGIRLISISLFHLCLHIVQHPSYGKLLHQRRFGQP